MCGASTRSCCPEWGLAPQAKRWPRGCVRGPEVRATQPFKFWHTLVHRRDEVRERCMHDETWFRS
jgi:hypothetical protein